MGSEVSWVAILALTSLLTACTPTIMPVAPAGVAPARMAPAVEGTPFMVPTRQPAAWLPIRNGTCPASHPIKANPDSMVYHQRSNDASYGRLVNPRVRCYADVEAVERDRFRHAGN